MNKWSVLYKTCVKGEEVLALSWVHNGLQIPFNPDKRECIQFGEKFPRAKFSPTMAHFGNKALDGWVAVTATGLVRLLLFVHVAYLHVLIISIRLR